MRARLKGLTVSLVFITYQMYEEQLALVFKGNAKENIEPCKTQKDYRTRFLEAFS